MVVQIAGGFDFDDDCTKTNKVGTIGNPQGTIPITQCQFRLRNEIDTTKAKFDLQTLLVDWLQKARSLTTMHFDARTDNQAALLFKHEGHESLRLILFVPCLP